MRFRSQLPAVPHPNPVLVFGVPAVIQGLLPVRCSSEEPLLSLQRPRGTWTKLLGSLQHGLQEHREGGGGTKLPSGLLLSPGRAAAGVLGPSYARGQPWACNIYVWTCSEVAV